MLLNERVRRTKVLIAGFDTEPGCEDRIFSVYREAALVVGNRFHTNVCSIAMEVPTIGLPTYVKLRHLYEELGLDDCLVDVLNYGFAQDLTSKCQSLLSSRIRHLKRLQKINHELLEQAQAAHIKISDFLSDKL
jgi:hypothetical protein